MLRSFMICSGLFLSASLVFEYAAKSLAGPSTPAQQNNKVRQDPAANGLTQAEFRRLHAELQPDRNALWRTIPWKISVLDAQNAAVEQKKPLFIWAMDGHPLGCT